MGKFEGILPALIVPLNEYGEVNGKLLTKHIDFLLENGVHGLYLGGSTGEGLVLPPEEREKVVDIAIKHISGSKKTVIVHVGAVDTKTAVRLAKHAEKAGADAVSSVPPFYYRVDESAIYNYYKALNDTVDLPLFIYNIPETTGVVINSVDAEKIVQLKNVIGIKFSSSDISEMLKMKELDGGKFSVFYGVDQILLAALVMGADGGIGGTYNIMPHKYVEVYEAVRQNDWIKASGIQSKISKYFHICRKYKNAISLMKVVLSVIHGEDMGKVTPPLRDLTEDERKVMIDDLKSNGFFEFIGLSI